MSLIDAESCPTAVIAATTTWQHRNIMLYLDGMPNAEVGVLLSAVYRFEDIILGLTPYGGLGPGFFFHRTATQAFQNTYVETEGRVAFQMMAGADYTLGPGAAFVEFRYHFSRVDFLATGNTNVGGFLALGLGYRLRF